MIYYTPQNQEGRIILCTTKVAAEAINKDYSFIEIATDKESLMFTLQGMIDDNHNLEEKLKSIPLVQSSYTSQSIEIENQWDKLPLTQKLHYAALVMEEAREKLSKGTNT